MVPGATAPVLDPEARPALQKRLAEPLYDADFHAWALEQTRLLRARRFDAIDLENLIDEVQDLAKRTSHALESNAQVLLHHLLKWRYQPSRRSVSWEVTIVEHRQRTRDGLDGNPSLRGKFSAMIEAAYPKAVKLAVTETRLAPATFPSACPFTLEQLLDLDFLPEAVEEA